MIKFNFFVKLLVIENRGNVVNFLELKFGFFKLLGNYHELNQFKSASINLQEKYFHKISLEAFYGEVNCNLFHLHALQI
jgi:hypothetical protein